MLATSLGLLLGGAILAAPEVMPAQDEIAYTGEAPSGLVGNGRSLVVVGPGEFAFHSGGDGKGRLALVVDGLVHDLRAADVRSTFFPGGVSYALTVAGVAVEVLHGGTAEAPYLVGVRVSHAKPGVALEVSSAGQPAVAPSGRVPIALAGGEGLVVVSAGARIEAASLELLRERLGAPARAGLRLATPMRAIDRAVPFNQFLLDLGFDGRLHVCEIFRWRDVWSRDLGSGLVPGAQAAGRFEAARATLEYDLRRYAAADPRGLKVTEDPSQGGSAEGTAWLTRALWRHYLLTGDRELLARAAETLRPWVRAWMDRDHAGTGLLVDVTEWMDHSRFFLFPDGARVLYSNVLFAELLGTFARIERELGDAAASARLAAARARSLEAINATLWNEAAGAYDNLSLWGRRDARSCEENALAVVAGVVPTDRVKRVLDGLKRRNWRPAGSVTITPPMSHVPPSNDHNYKMWPWWNAVEARARLRNGDVEGGLHLLERSAATLEDRHFPGLMEELTTPDGVTEGGNAFLTAAGSFLDAVTEGLLGIDILEPGCARLRVAPNVPAAWQDWSAEVPLPGGAVALVSRGGKLAIRVTDPRVKVVEAPARASVEGAQHAVLSPLSGEKPRAWKAPAPATVAAPRERRAALFHEDGVPSAALPGLPSRRVGADQLATLDPADVGALVVAGNALPRRTWAGVDLEAALARYLDRGGALVFFGASMQDRGTMGETGGVVDWYEYRPTLRFEPLSGWRVRASQDAPTVDRESERGLRDGWFRRDFADDDWLAASVPSFWEGQLGGGYEGWGWYRAHFALPAEARGKSLVVDLGAVDDDEWTFVNGVPVGSTQGARRVRRYQLGPGHPAYESLRFGGDNVVAVQVRDKGGMGGLWDGQPGIGAPTGVSAWTPVSPIDGMAREKPVRHGVVSWGPGRFFNSWETSRGAFGFAVEGQGARFTAAASGVKPLSVPVREAFTDFAVSRPWSFEPLAFTETRRKLLEPDRGERYPCAARIVNGQTGGEIVLISAAVAGSASGPALLRALRIR